MWSCSDNHRSSGLALPHAVPHRHALGCALRYLAWRHTMGARHAQGGADSSFLSFLCFLVDLDVCFIMIDGERHLLT
eukprot:1699055-Rhodomonas_salina.1